MSDGDGVKAVPHDFTVVGWGWGEVCPTWFYGGGGWGRVKVVPRGFTGGGGGGGGGGGVLAKCVFGGGGGGEGGGCPRGGLGGGGGGTG